MRLSSICQGFSVILVQFRLLQICLILDFVDGIVKHMKGKAGPNSKDLKTVADAEKFLANSEHSIVGMSVHSYSFDLCDCKLYLQVLQVNKRQLVS